VGDVKLNRQLLDCRGPIYGHSLDETRAVGAPLLRCCWCFS